MIDMQDIKLNERQRLFNHFEDKLETAYHLNRKIVSFQANKTEPFYRWFKYKEGFSSSLVKYFLTEFSSKTGKLLDPFAGAGTTLFAGQELGWESTGIELLPVGAFAIKTREAINHANIVLLDTTIKTIWEKIEGLKVYENHIRHIPITKDAFPTETEVLLNKYLEVCLSLEDIHVQTIMRFAAFSILEQISYTRKDGQYLRWDYRSPRNLSGKAFNKGTILDFKDAISAKLADILSDLHNGETKSLFSLNNEKRSLELYENTCLEQLPKLENSSYNFIITSPPYCNRYDYTRTYALELIFLGYDNEQVRDLRQNMLSCTVENKDKIESLKVFYQTINRSSDFENILTVYNNSKAMAEVNSILEKFKQEDKLNNSNIGRMVKNYFLEMCFVIFEMGRILKNKGRCVMVNDNVRYGGEEIPVDLILSEFAENFGFVIEKIFVLPKGKGNSSQQMGAHGRTEIRKCVYLWQKINA